MLKENVCVPTGRDSSTCVIAASMSNAFKCPRCRRHNADQNGSLCVRCTGVLSDGWDM